MERITGVYQPFEEVAVLRAKSDAIETDLRAKEELKKMTLQNNFPEINLVELRRIYKTLSREKGSALLANVIYYITKF